jgi:hypothetical protein
VFVDGVLCVQQVFHSLYWECDRNPVPGRTVLELVKLDSVTSEPAMNRSGGVFRGLHQLVNLIG